MKHRKLRIAWSVVWGIAAVLLIAFWVKSYSIRDELRYVTTAGYTGAAIDFGTLELFRVQDPKALASGIAPGWNRTRFGGLIGSRDVLRVVIGRCGIENGRLIVPIWFSLLVLCVTGYLPWAKWWSNRFSLRTLLIATTIIAFGFGIVVWAIR